MYKIIIVDDEKNIRDRLAHFFPWSEAGFEVVGIAENGVEALELIKLERPHAVLTDVLMPEMTGLELAKEIQKSYSDIKVVILSAYDDFKYAQEAIRFGVKGYLLKPLMKNDFFNVFTKLAEELREDEEAKAVDRVEELMLLDLIKGENLSQYADQWNQHTQSFRVAIFSFDRLFKEVSTFSIRQKITELAADFCNRYQVSFLFYGNSLIVLSTDSKLVSKKDLMPKIHLFIDSLKLTLVIYLITRRILSSVLAIHVPRIMKFAIPIMKRFTRIAINISMNMKQLYFMKIWLLTVIKGNKPKSRILC